MEKIDAMVVLSELEKLYQGKTELWQEKASNALCDGIQLVKKYIAVQDVVRNPDGADHAGKIGVADILNPMAEVQMENSGWKLLTWEEFKRGADGEG